MDAVEIVRRYLKAQNLEQIGRVEEAIEHYEAAVNAQFDSSGPYDRLITMYANRADHAEVVRVATSALAHVHTHEEKKAWYERMRAAAQEEQAKVPPAAPKHPE